MRRQLFSYVALPVLSLLTSGRGPLNAQTGPDILWLTNAHPSDVFSVAFSPDSSVLASGSSTGPAKLWRLSDTALLQVFSIPGNDVLAVAFSPDGSRLVGSGTADRGALWSTADAGVIWYNYQGGTSPVFAPDGNLIAAGDGPDVIFLSAENGYEVQELDGNLWQVINAVAFSPDGTLLASGSDDRTAKVWRLADGAVLQDFSHSGYVIAVAFSPDGKLLATGLFDGPTRLWDVANGNLVRVLNSGATPSLKFSPDGKLLLTASAGLLEFWRVGDGTLLKRYDQNVESGAIVVDISPNGKFFAYGRVDGTVVLAWMPVVIDEFTRTDDTLCLSWWGGSGRYQVQQSTNLTSGAWENAGGPTTNTTFTAPLTLTTAALFYRVQSLTHAP